MALGSNVGNRVLALQRLRRALEGGGVRLTAASGEVVTTPVGPREQRDFLNCVVRLDADRPLLPLEWLERCQAAEREAGRRPTYHWGPRRADADILLLGADGRVRVDLPQLRVPHPELRNRPFLVSLLAALDPGLRPPDGLD